MILSFSRLSWMAAVAGLAAIASAFTPRVSPAIPTFVSPDTGWAELQPRGRIRELHVGPDGRVWMGSMQGEIFTADSVNGKWRLVLGPPRDPDAAEDFGLGLPEIDRVTWLSARTAIASGYIGPASSERKELVLRTTDGGARWDRVSVGEDQWVYDAFVDRNGGVWLGGSSGALVFSGDSGRTWRTVSRPFDGSTRLHSIWMDDGRTGVVAALGNALKATDDGGRTWRSLPTPLDQARYVPPKQEGHNDHRFEAVALLDGTLWAVQEGHLFTSPLAEVRWTEVSPGDPLAVFTVDRASGTVYALGRSLHLYEIGADRVPRRLAEQPLYAAASHLEARAGAVYAVDDEAGVYRVSRDRVVYSRPLTRGVRARVWHVGAADGVTWGASAYGLYTTADDGRGWRLVGTSPHGIRGMLVMDGGRVMVWDRHGFNAAFDGRTGRLEEIAALRGYDVVNVLAGDSLWVAYGGAQFESAGRVDVARTFFAGEFAGTRPNGFVLVSRDRGRTWTPVDEWPEHGVQAVFVHPDGAMTLLSYLGSVRRLTPADSGYQAQALVTADVHNRESVPYVQEAGAMYFDGREGWLDGWIHHLGNRRYATHDGGRTWTQVATSGHHYRSLVPAPGGWIGLTGHRLFWIAGATEREIFDGGGEEARADLEADFPSIPGFAVAADGSVRVLLRSGEVRTVPLPR